MADPRRPIVETTLGPLRGVREADHAVFRGVPYAKPPTGPLRFRPPEPAERWDSVREADRDGPIAPQQHPYRLERVMGRVERPEDEDCLTLTVWTPALGPARRPVVVWIHGGGYNTGAGSLPFYDGGALAAAGDIVVVGVNYRLGVLGFLYRQGLIEQNLALLDMAAAVKWVVANIEAFGGDPGQLTLWGQSAGANACALLLHDDTVRPSVKRMILQSGAFGRPPRTAADATAFADQVCARLGVEAGAKGALAGLQAASVADILAAQSQTMASGQADDLMFRPVAPAGEASWRDGVKAVAERLGGLQLLIGCTSNEAFAHLGGSDVPLAAAEAAILAHSGDPEVLARYKARLPGADGAALLAEYRGDTTYIHGTRALALAAAAAGAETYAYEFGWSPPASPFRACHCIDLPFAFGNRPLWGEAPMLAGGDEAQVAALSRVVSGAFASFVRDGVADLGPGLPAWPKVSQQAPMAVEFGRRIRLRPLDPEQP